MYSIGVRINKKRTLCMLGNILTIINHNLKHVKLLHPKTDLKLVLELYQVRTKKPKRKRSPTNSCKEAQGTNTDTVNRNTAGGDVNCVAENSICS